MMSKQITRLRLRASSWRWAMAAILSIGILSGAALVALPAVSPETGAATADLLRAVVGPGPVAGLESVSNWMRDTLYRTASELGLNPPSVSWASVNGSVPFLAPDASQPAVGAQKGPHAAGMAKAALKPPAMDVVNAAPSIGWQPYGAEFGGVPLMSRALIMLDPQRSYSSVALVRMDLTRLSLHITPGFIEPAHPSGVDQRISDIGRISPQDYGLLVAAFNGGFKALHGHYGMMVNGVTLLPPIDGIGTVALYRDGTVRIGAWGREITPSVDILSFRQNCPPLVEAGQIDPALLNGTSAAWGFTNNSDITWRTGLGISSDGRFLIYAVGNGTGAEFLAHALLEAGAYNAMQLDINQYYAHFVTYAANPATSTPVAQPLLQQMIDIRQLFLVPYPRDFFYLTQRQ
jgi:phosphodiester glycosidase